jgi:hypothetical protein
MHHLTGASRPGLCRFIESGGVFKLVFGPKAFIVVSDPVVVRYLLKVCCRLPSAQQLLWLESNSEWSSRMHAPTLAQENAMNYDKGVLAEILEPIMGKGLIPADLETWKVRGRMKDGRERGEGWRDEAQDGYTHTHTYTHAAAGPPSCRGPCLPQAVL